MRRKDIRKNREALYRKEKRNYKKKLLSRAVLTGTTATFIFGSLAPASAAPVEENQPEQSSHNASNDQRESLNTNTDSDNQTLDAETTEEEDSEEDSEETTESETTYESYLVIISSEDIETITLRDEQESLHRSLKDRGISVSGYRDEDGNRVTVDDLKEYTLDNRETLVLNASNRKIESEEVELSYKTEEIETDMLLEGEQWVEQEGSDGVGMNVTITYSNGEHNTTENRFTVTQAPVSEIVYIGTGTPEPETISPVSESGAGSESGAEAESYIDESGQGVRTPDDLVSLSDTPSATGHAVVDTMLTQVGGKYSWGGTSPATGMDCSGLIMWAAQQNGLSIPRVSGAQGRAGTPVSWDNIQVGDLIWTDSHIGVYAGNDKIVHALNPRVGIRVDSASTYRNQGFNVSRIF